MSEYTQEEMDRIKAEAVHNALAKKGYSSEELDKKRAELARREAEVIEAEQDIESTIGTLAAAHRLPVNTLKYGISGKPRISDTKTLDKEVKHG